MSLYDLFALGIGGLILASAAMVVFSRNAMYAAIYLLLTLLGIAGEFVLLQAHFLAIIQVLVYAGAVVVLIVFVLMLMGFGREKTTGLQVPGFAMFIALMLAGLVVAGVGFGLWRSPALVSTGKVPDKFGTIDQVSRSLVTTNVVAFEVISVLLLMAIVGVVVVLRTRSKGAEEAAPEAESDEKARV